MNGKKKELIVGKAIGKVVASLAATAMLVMVGLMPAFAAGQVPFKGQFSGSFTFTDSSDLNLVGTGNASFLGRSTSNGHIAFLSTPATCTGGFAIHDDETLMSTDDGDQVSFSIDNQACPTATPGIYEILTRYNVTGGTGRFAGASGQGTADCFGNFNNDTFNFTLTGTIS
jgi:hypothetical protein